MKKNFWIRNIILAILLIVIIGGVSYYFIKKNGRKYEIEKVENYNYFVLKQNNLSGVIDKEGNKVIEPNFDEVKIPNPEKGIFVCYNSEQTKVLNEKSEEIFSKYKNIEPIRLKNIASDLMYEKSVLKFSKDEKYGLVDFNGKEIAKPIYEEITNDGVCPPDG